MKVQVVTGRYPSTAEPYNHMFVHTRNLQYIKKGHEVEIYVPAKVYSSYNIDGIQVYLVSVQEIVKKLKIDSIVMVHLLLHSLIKELDAGVIYDYLIKYDKPTLFFIHGIETQSIWRSRREDIQASKPKSIARFLYNDFYRISNMKSTFQRIISHTKNIEFVTVSQWMREDTEKTLGVLIAPRTSIIANGIDITLFQYQDHWENREKLLSIRPLSLKGKYAVDLALETMEKIAHRAISLTIYGKGKDKQKIVNHINHKHLQERVSIENDFIPHDKIHKVHSQYGIYYAVTRMDAQGVSMCEAMASGMPTVSFDTCAIPEYIKDGETGILIPAYDTKIAAEKITELISNKNLFTKLSENGRKSMEKIDISITTQNELNIAKKLL